MKSKSIYIIALFLFVFGFTAKAQSPLDKRINQLVDAMSLEEKVDQMINNRNSFGSTRSNTRLNIPGFFMSDGPHGVRFTAENFGRTATAYPTGIAMTATWDEDLIYRIGEAMGVEFWSHGRTQALGPCLDLSRDSRGGRTAESGGEDPYLSGHLAKALTQGIQQYPVVATLKHFMGESMQKNRLQMNVTATQRWLMDFSGYNFRTAMQEAGVFSIMGSYNKINGEKASENSILQKTILRERWGFPFYIVSDWAGIDDARGAVRAGTDICMGSSIYEADLPILLENNFLTTAQIDYSVQNILRTKILSGLMDYYPEGNTANINTQEITELNLLAAKKSIILLKNEQDTQNKAILPLSKTGVKVALIGPNALAENLNCYGSSGTNPPYAISMKKGLDDLIGASNVTYAKGCDMNGTSSSGFAQARNIAASADYVIFAGGLDDTQEGEGYGSGTDRVGGSFALPTIQQLLINEIASVNPNIIVVLQSGGVCTLNNCLHNIKGLVYSFYAAQEAGHAIASVLFGDYNPAGRMPLSMPMNDSDFPAWEESIFAQFENNLDGGYRWLDENNITPRYAFGFGLSYTDYAYTNLIAPTEITAGQPFTVTVNVTNTGDRVGEEVVQLYVSAPTDKIWMPKKELRGFQRIALAAGETKTVSFKMCADDFYYWNHTSRKYEVQTGNYTIRLGGSSDNLPLAQQINFKQGTAKPDLRITQVYTMPRYPVAGQPVSFYALVKNQGNASTTLQQIFNINYSVAGQNVASTKSIKKAIAPGQVQLIASDGEWVAEALGKTSLSAEIVFNNSSVEWDIENNTYEKTYELFAQENINSEYKNIAFLKNVTVSSQVGKFIGLHAVDGDLTTRWDSKSKGIESVMVDLEALCEVDKVQLYWGDAYAKSYRIEKSLNGTDWVSVAEKTNGSGSAEKYDFDTFETRYIRVNFTEAKSGAGNYGLNELKVLGRELQQMPGARVRIADEVVLLPHAKTYVDGTASTNPSGEKLNYVWQQVSGSGQATILEPTLALTEIHFETAGDYVFSLTVSNGVDEGWKEFSIQVTEPTNAHDLALRKSTSASSSEKPTMYPQAAVDGNNNTRWASLHKNGEWWQIDLQHQVKPSEIAILWHREYAKKYQIEISSDGKTWTTYTTNNAFSGGTSTDINQNNVSGRYVRVTCVERSGQWENSFNTFNLYGEFATGVNKLPVARATYHQTDNVFVLDASSSSDADATDQLSYTWEQITGPAFVKIDGENTSTATITNPQAGSYFFKLTVDDGKDIDYTILHVLVADETGVKKTDAEIDLQIFPNPFTDKLQFQGAYAKNLSHAKVYNVSGMLMASKPVHNAAISLTELSEGMYFLTVFDDKRKLGDFKLIKLND